ncbi:hypothetical protein ACFQL4_02210 [Halosimplex aquaticum]
MPWARSIKAIAADEGVSDWTAYVDPSLTVDEHREVMADAAREGGGKRQEDTETATEKAGRASRRAQAEGCDHARGHCENGDTDACEFLQESCGYDPEEVDQILGDTRHVEDDDPEQRELVTVGGGEYPEMEVTAQEARALRQSWQGYKGAVSDIEEAQERARKGVIHARQAVRAINAIRGQHDQGEIHPNRLHDLLESLAQMPGDIPEVRTLDHFRGRQTRGTPTNVHQPIGARPIEQGHGRRVEQGRSGGQFAQEMQGTLGGDTTVTEDRQFTLTGEDASEATGPLPADWTRRGTNWEAGPYKVQVDGDPAAGLWDVKLYGDGERFEIAEVRDATTAERIAEEFTDRVAPDEVSFHSSTRPSWRQRQRRSERRRTTAADSLTTNERHPDHSPEGRPRRTDHRASRDRDRREGRRVRARFPRRRRRPRVPGRRRPA